MTHCATFEVSLCDGLQLVSLQQQQRQIVQILKRRGADAADLVVGQSQLLESRWQKAGHRAQVVVVGKQVVQLGLLLQQGGLVQLVALQFVVVQDEPAQPSNVGQDRRGQGRDVVALRVKTE